MSIVRGEPLGADRHVAVVAARFNERVTTKLVDGARAGRCLRDGRQKLESWDESAY